MGSISIIHFWEVGLFKRSVFSRAYTNQVSFVSYTDDCDLLKETNDCSNGFFISDSYKWSQNLTITSGAYSNSNWCFCHLKPYSNEHYFKITLNKFRADFNDELKWFSHYKKMPSKLQKTSTGVVNFEETFNIYSNIVQAQWISNSFELLFSGIHVTIESL